MDNLCFDFSIPDPAIAWAPGDADVHTDTLPGLQDIASFDDLFDNLLSEPEAEEVTVELAVPPQASAPSPVPELSSDFVDSLFAGMVDPVRVKRPALVPPAGRPLKTKRVATSPGIGCGCSKRKCRTLYCSCFRAGVACDPNVCLSCSGSCCNKENNPNGARASRKDHCNCRRNKCLKKYCECKLAGRTCGPKCHCAKDCLNC